VSSKRTAADDSGKTLRGLWLHLGLWTILELKSIGRPYRSGDLDRLWGYLHLYYADERARIAHRDDLRAALVVPARSPALSADMDAMRLQWKDLGAGYWQIKGGLFPLYVEASARTASLMAGARELLARNQPAAATRLLLELREPAMVRGWIELATDVLAGPLPRPTLRGHAAPVVSAAWSPDGTRIVTSSYDKTARIWPIAIPSLQQALRAATTDCLSLDQRQIYLNESEADARKAYEACERSYGRKPFYPDAKEP
jgi:hypothetical protein